MRLLPLVLVLSLSAACASGGSSRSASMSMPTDDASITAQVKTVLLNDPQVNATKIDVSSQNGVVTMSGTVRSKADEDRAVQLARQVRGVKDVKSSLNVGGA
jgi:osmotically-inducible protein OsmY